MADATSAIFAPAAMSTVTGPLPPSNVSCVADGLSDHPYVFCAEAASWVTLTE